MSRECRILIFAGSGIGGTEKCASLFARELSRRGHQVGYVSKSGPRVVGLEEEGVKIIEPSDDPENIAKIIRSFRPDVIHQHVSGYQNVNPIYKALWLIKDRKPKLIETNVFGRFEDREGLIMVDYRMFVSAASAVQAYLRSGIRLTENSLGNNIMVYNPVAPFSRILTIDEIKTFRRDLGVKEEEILFYRVGQSGHKWTDWEFDAFKVIKNQVSNARLLLIEPPQKLWLQIEPVADSLGIILRRSTSDFTWLEKLNQSADIAIHASAWGESFGYTIAEAMMAGRPVITRSTPWGDNAQAELVNNGNTGFICLTTGEMARQGIELAKDAALRRSMGGAGRIRIQKLAGVETETEALEAVMEQVMTGERSDLIRERQQELVHFSRSFVKKEYGFSEQLTDHPWEKVRGLIFLFYKKLRGKFRTLLSKKGYYRA